ncbi:MAG TPA: AAA family ATPase [Actinomycetota bacterium]|nr:AAA family ATPase [Actinomycetota bacterium]
MVDRASPNEPTLIHLAGPFVVTSGGRSLGGRELGSRKGRVLLMLLAANRARAVPVDEIAEALWPDGPPGQFERNVATLVSRLRSVLGADAVAGGRDGYRLGAGSVDVDVEVAGRLAAEARARLATDEPALALAAANRAIDLLAGGVLDGEPDAGWADDVRAEAEHIRHDARRTAWRAAPAAGDPEAARAAAEAGVRADPLDEEAARALMQAHHAAGNDAAALAEFERLRTALGDELGVDPSAETADLHLAVLRGDEHASPQSAPAPAGTAEEAPVSGDPGFVGRDREVADLAGAWTDAAERRSSFVLVTGEAGIGKSRLADEVVALATGTGGLVAAARCYEAERSLFLQPVADALRSVAMALPPDALRRAAGAEAGALAVVVPEIGAILRPHGYQPADAELERRRSFEAVRAFLVALGERAPVLLYLDDLQNAGSSTLELLHFLGRRTSRARLAVVATVRVEEGDDVLGQLGGVARRIDVGPLPRGAVDQLARRMGAAERSDRVFATTGGHTLSVVESLRALAEGDEGSEDVPPTLADAVRTRVQRLGPDVDDLLGVAAVLGSTFDPATTASMLDVPLEEAVRRVEVARHGRLVIVAGDQYSFANDLVREILYRGTPEPVRKARHRKAAALSEANPEAVARHATAAGEWATAVDAWVRAGVRAASRYANRDAARMFDGAVDAALAAGDRAAEATARLERGRVGEALAEFDGAYRDQVAALAAAREIGDRRLEMRALRELGGDPLIALGRPAAECVPYLESALRIAVEIADAAAEVDIRSRLAVLAVNRLRFPEARDQAGRAVGLARELGDDVSLMVALDGRKTAVAYDGDIEELEGLTLEIERLARRAGRLMLVQWAVFESAFVPMARGRWSRAIERMRAALELNRRVGYHPHASMFLAHMGWVHRSRGRYEQALAVGRQALVQAEEADHPWWSSFAAVMLGATLLEAGDPERASRTLEAGLRFAERDGAETYLVRCSAHLALARAQAGDVAGAEEHLQAAERILTYASNPPGSNFLHGAHATLAAARAALALGSAERAARLAGPVLQAAEALGWVEPHAEAALVLARCRLLEGDRSTAIDLATSSAGLAARTGLGRLTWEALAVRSDANAAAGRDEAALADRSDAEAAAAAVARTLDGGDRSTFLARAEAVIRPAEPAAG